MIEVCFLLKTGKTGTLDEATKKLKAIQEVKEVKQVSGIYDIIATFQCKDLKESGEIEKKVRSIVRVVNTCIVIG